MLKTLQSPFKSTKLISLDKYFEEMVELYESGTFPKVLLLNGKKGIGKFTLIFHFINYIYTKTEKNSYNVKEKLININSNFYSAVLNQTCPDVIFLQAEEGKNIKIEDIRNLKTVLSRSTLSNNPRFTIIDEVEFLNANAVNALLKTLEEPSDNNYFILTNNQQADLIETISSRCLKSNIFLNIDQRKKVIDYFMKEKKIPFYIDDISNLTPGLLLKYNELFYRYKIENDESIFFKLKKLLHAYKKDKDKALISMSIFFIDKFFYQLVKRNEKKIDLFLNLKLFIIKKINDYITYNLNINSVLNSIELKLKYVR